MYIVAIINSDDGSQRITPTTKNKKNEDTKEVI